MVTREQIERINELYKKSKEFGLTEQEKKEQEELRRLYVKAVRENLKSQLQNIKIVSPEEYEKLTNAKKCGCGHEHLHKDDSCNCKGHKH